jgi:hypothetical protein
VFDLPKADQLILAKATAPLPAPERAKSTAEASRAGVN